ncbi:EAL domain-containing protein [Photobacterium sp. 1_MG-2023]|uniref:EAL domain-containing protein n=1 Tax=Photobacterium sp. 1_MG-2023 TaxID=3062646 RepID=UPI0026E12C1C|nr:EAL domain-containing protein [Photobacterium sp. 1_MG-2023]MDO6705600.1 EAL domain-containing protein [Photobacterium sp. 1_MG-2023]
MRSLSSKYAESLIMNIHCQHKKTASYRTTLWQCCITLSIFLGIIAIGFLGVYLHARYSLQSQIYEKETILNNLFQNILDDAYDATHQAAQLLEQECNLETSNQLKRISVLISNIRTLNLLKDNYIYCSSAFNKPIPKNKISYLPIQGNIFLIPSSYYSPDKKTLIVSHQKSNGVAVAMIDTTYVRKLLNTITKNIPLTITLNNLQSVEFNHGDIDISSATKMSQSSINKEFTISAYVSRGMYLDYLKHEFYIHLYLCVLIAILVSANRYRQLNRPRSPQEELKRAVLKQEFSPFIQPIVNRQGQLCGAEVLIRWQHPSQGIIRPDFFIPLAEETGLISIMTTQILYQLKQSLIQNIHLLPDNFHLAINISASQCDDLQLYQDCLNLLSHLPEGKLKLVVELTERAIIEDTHQTHHLFEKLHQLGAQIALDDFGTGHSSLSYINQFDVDIIKIDKSFTNLIKTVDHPNHIVDNVLDLAARLNIEVVAEGVENAIQEDYLKQRHIRYFQGYFYGRPIALEHFFDQLATLSAAEIDTLQATVQKKQQPDSGSSAP